MSQPGVHGPLGLLGLVGRLLDLARGTAYESFPTSQVLLQISERNSHLDTCPDTQEAGSA